MHLDNQTIYIILGAIVALAHAIQALAPKNSVAYTISDKILSIGPNLYQFLGVHPNPPDPLKTSPNNNAAPKGYINVKLNKGIFALCLAIAGMAIAGGYASKAVVQSGNGANGMTYTLLADGGDAIAAVTGSFSSTQQNCALLTLQASGSNNITSASGVAYLRAEQYAPCPGNTSLFCYSRYPAADVSIDAGVTSTTLGPGALGNIYTFGPIALPQSNVAGSGWAWYCDNCQQSTTLDAGMTLLEQLYTGTGDKCQNP